MEDQVFNWKDLLSVNNHLNKFKRVCDSSKIQEGADVRLFRDFTTSSTLASVKSRLSLLSNDTDK